MMAIGLVGNPTIAGKMLREQFRQERFLEIHRHSRREPHRRH
jgi:hypothetical protein